MPIEEVIKYGHTNDLSRMPTVYSQSYDEAVRYAKNDQPANRPFYIIELCEHYEVCGILDNNGDEYLCSMPNDAPTHFFIKERRRKTMPDNKPLLKNCPFCGGEPSAILGYIRYLDEDGNYTEFEEDERIWFCACVYCPWCGSEIERKKLATGHHDDEWYEQIRMDAVNSWNRRKKVTYCMSLPDSPKGKDHD